MSQETSEWLNQNVLVGFTSKRGTAWHYRASDQGDEPNHYEGPIPEGDVQRRLFHWDALEGSVETTVEIDGQPVHITDDNRKAIVRSDTKAVLGIFRPSFQIHPYGQWLVEQVQTIADSDLDIASAGLLKGGAVAWVQFELPDTFEVEGVEFRPFLTGATSLDGSLSSTYNRGVQAVVCDNTLQGALSDRLQQVKIKHSRKSLGRIGEVKDALGLIYSTADEFALEVQRLTATTVTDAQWAKFLEEIAPMPEGDEPSKRSVNKVERKRDELNNLWLHDERAATWKGTAYGVLAAVNTWSQHLQDVRNVSRVERNMQDMVEGKIAKNDAATMDALNKVLVATK